MLLFLMITVEESRKKIRRNCVERKVMKKYVAHNGRRINRLNIITQKISV